MPVTATNTIPVSLPPTRVLSTTKITPAQAQTFLANFILTADVDRNASARGDIVVSDQRRIEKALQGVYMPKPVEKPIVKAAPIAEPAAAQEWEQQDEEMAQAGGEEVVAEAAAPSGGAVDKEKRKADKKARAKEDRKRKAEERAKEKAL
jgi:hypothetical protein